LTDAPQAATPTHRSIPLRHADFETLSEALAYAAKGESGFNFYDARGRLDAVLPYAELAEGAHCVAARLHALGLPRGARVTMLAETTPAFAEQFFGCQLAGLVPVPLPVSVNLGGREAYQGYLERLIRHCGARAFLFSEGGDPDEPAGLVPTLARALALTQERVALRLGAPPDRGRRIDLFA